MFRASIPAQYTNYHGPLALDLFAFDSEIFSPNANQCGVGQSQLDLRCVHLALFANAFESCNSGADRAGQAAGALHRHFTPQRAAGERQRKKD